MIDRARTLYQRAIAAWTVAKQIMVYFEESAELQKEVAKYERYKEFFDLEENWAQKGLQLDRIVDEIADTQVMVEQLQVIYNIESDVSVCYKDKLQRLENRLEKHDVAKTVKADDVQF